jgi:hypothetical protein
MPAVLERVVLEAAGPELPDPAVVPLLRLGAWAAAFQAHAADLGHPDRAVAETVERFARLEPPREPAGDAFRAARDALRRAPLGDALGPLWSIQLAGSLHAMVWDRRGRMPLTARRDLRGALDAYLERAADSVCVALMMTSAAMLIGERGALTAIAPLTEVERHASIAARLAQDLATWTAAPSPRNGVALTSADAVRARVAAERGALDASLAALAASAPQTAGFARRFTDAFIATTTHVESIAA